MHLMLPTLLGDMTKIMYRCVYSAQDYFFPLLQIFLYFFPLLVFFSKEGDTIEKYFQNSLFYTY